MTVVDRTIVTGFRDQMLNTDFGATGWVLKDYIIDVYPNLIPGVKTPALWMWGSNSSGQLGNNTVVNRSSPAQTITGGANWSQAACGYQHTACVKTDGTLWMWGGNSYSGQLGDNTIVDRSSPVQTITGGTNWKQVACGYFHTAGVKTDGTLWLWGRNAYGELGIGNTGIKSSPVQTITGGANWTQVSASSSFVGFSAGVKSDGTLWLWGFNGYGQLGDNTTVNKSSPVQTITGGTNWKQVSCGYGHVACVKTDGTLWLWGNNTIGQLGNNTTARRSSPVQTIAGGTNWKQVACGQSHTAAVKTDGTLWLWGFNAFGQLGNNTTGSRSSPVQTIAGGTNWKNVSCGSAHTACVKSDGALWLWGFNAFGQLGKNTTGNRSSPVQTIAGGTTWKLVAGGIDFTAAIADGNY